MTEDRLLFQVSHMDEGTSVKVCLENELDYIEVATAIHDVITDHPKMLEVLEFINFMAMTDPKFKELKQKNTISIPNFDELLKNTK